MFSYSSLSFLNYFEFFIWQITDLYLFEVGSWNIMMFLWWYYVSLIFHVAWSLALLSLHLKKESNPLVLIDSSLCPISYSFALMVCWNFSTWWLDFHKALLSIGDCQNQCSLWRRWYKTPVCHFDDLTFDLPCFDITFLVSVVLVIENWEICLFEMPVLTQ